MLPGDHVHRWVALTLLNGTHLEMWELREIDHSPANMPVDGIVQVKLADGTVKTLERISRTFADATNFYVEYGSWEQWKFLNLSTVVHPMHLHLVSFQTIGRGRERFNIASFDNEVGGAITPVTYEGPGTLDASEQDWRTPSGLVDLRAVNWYRSPPDSTAAPAATCNTATSSSMRMRA
jgi:FtsP/CotA-like multicopper oxidase with cupredoxin domain